jgi:hypothetical protein
VTLKDVRNDLNSRFKRIQKHDEETTNKMGLSAKTIEELAELDETAFQHSSNSSRDFATNVANTVTKVQTVMAIAKTMMTTPLVMTKTEVTGVNAITAASLVIKKQTVVSVRRTSKRRIKKMQLNMLRGKLWMKVNRTARKV